MSNTRDIKKQLTVNGIIQKQIDENEKQIKAATQSNQLNTQ